MAVRILGSKDIEDRVEELCEMMNEEASVCRELLELSRIEQEYLMKNDIENLSVNTEKMKRIVQVLKRNQAARHSYMDDIAINLEKDVGTVTISAISREVDPELSSKLKDTSRELIKVGERLYRSNHNTIYLIDFSLDLLEQQNKLWAELVSDEKEGYSANGKKGNRKSHPLLVEEKV
ncbi:MAG: flagellar export chaperone FlgN [Candidatus Krumholzibacteriota bacterium]|nr:flagellar export chaperone FlgN [Candidatus Krumholzibacteriota bacterium]